MQKSNNLIGCLTRILNELHDERVNRHVRFYEFTYLEKDRTKTLDQNRLNNKSKIRNDVSYLAIIKIMGIKP